MLHLTTPHAAATVHPLGSHVTAYTTDRSTHPVLYLSPRATFTLGEAIRGGVPICFPWFRDHPTDPSQPSHGTVRTRTWSTIQHAGSTAVLTIDAHPFHADVTVTLTDDDLTIALTATNESSEPATFTNALHTYLAVSDVRRVTVTGLEGVGHLDQLTGERHPPTGGPLTLTGETDRVYLDTTDAVTIHDPSWSRTLTLTKAGSRSTVVWNPWADKARRIADLPDDGWPGFLCVEAGNIADHAITLAPGETHTTSTTITPRVGTL